MMKNGVQGPLGQSGNTPPPALVYNPPANNGLSILFEDASLLVVSKPTGLLSVAGNSSQLQDCMESRVKQQFPTALTVHRLDRATSGIFAMALDPETHRNLGLQFERRQTRKAYIAIVSGCVSDSFGFVDQSLRTDWYNRPKQMVDPYLGRDALTYWKVLERYEEKTRLELKPVTGRSHQLRVHMQWLGHPIIGDEFYSRSESYETSERLMLHAQSLEFEHPVTSERVVIHDQCPF